MFHLAVGVVDQAQVAAAGLVQNFLDGPVLAVETTDHVLQLIADTSMSDPETWKKLEHSVTTTEKNYARDVHDQLSNWKWQWDQKNGPRHSFLFNFRTGTCIYYDLGG
jgi:translation initiation factor 2-alpha kinase 4